MFENEPLKDDAIVVCTIDESCSTSTASSRIKDGCCDSDDDQVTEDDVFVDEGVEMHHDRPRPRVPPEKHQHDARRSSGNRIRYLKLGMQTNNDNNNISNTDYNDDNHITSNTLQLNNAVIPATFLLTGILQGLMGPIIATLPLQLGATEAQQLTVAAIHHLPSTFRIVIAFLSDNVRLAGYRRKSYMTLGWMLASVSLLMTSLVVMWAMTTSSRMDDGSATEGCFIGSSSTTSSFNEDHDHDGPASNSTSAANMDHDDITTSSSNIIIAWLACGIIGYATGFLIADVMGDSIVAERCRRNGGGTSSASAEGDDSTTKTQQPKSRHLLQTTCYACQFGGKMVAAPISLWLYETSGPVAVIVTAAVLPLTIFPLIYAFREDEEDNNKESRTEPKLLPSEEEQRQLEAEVDGFIKVDQQQQQKEEIDNEIGGHSSPDSIGGGSDVSHKITTSLHTIWTQVMCNRAVWQPLGFVFLYNVCQVHNGAWTQYLRSTLHFTTCQLNLLLILAYVLLYVGVMIYKVWLIEWSWRSIYIGVTCLNIVVTILTLLLLHGYTFGLPAIVFAMGDDGMADLIHGIQILPIAIMLVHLCPAGSEGTTYAMFSTTINSARAVKVALSSQLLQLWDVSKSTLVAAGAAATTAGSASGGLLSGMSHLTLLTGMVQCAALLFIRLLPNNKKDVDALTKLQHDEHNNDFSNRIGGMIFLTVLVVTNTYSIIVGIVNIVGG